MPGDWVYLRVPDPGNGQYHIVSAVRSDGVPISVNTNVWTTDRTFIGLARPPVGENILHLLDYNSTGRYTLTYEPGSTISSDTNAPASMVNPLPPVTRQYFQVSWAGHDEGQLGQPLAGIAYYDIYVSENSGQVAPWLQQTHLVSATYMGAVGSHYAFYSVATDANGNREQPPGTPDAETLVGITNSPPSITISNLVSINEGETLDLPFTVSDLDTNQVLNVSLSGDTPPGVVLNAAARRLTWPTGEGHGPSTNVITLVVRDDDFLSLSMTGRVTVVVKEVNLPPSLDAVTNRAINEGQLLTFIISASDSDLPRQTLTFSLGAGAPAGLALDSTSGAFTWRPTELQGGTNYTIAVIVRDSGSPPLSATQTFVVTVRDTQGDFGFAIGSTNLFVGESNSVPLTFSSGAAELTNLSFVLEADTTRLVGFALRSLASEITSSSLAPLSSNQFQVLFTTSAADAFQGSLTLARLNFIALSNGHSAIVPLRASNVVGALANGTTLAKPRVGSGRVFVIGREPLLDAHVSSNHVRVIRLYGHPNRRYALEFKSDLLNSPDWISFQEVDLESRFAVFSDLPAPKPVVFYRGREVGLIVPFGIERVGGNLFIEWPQATGNCVLERSTSLDSPMWSVVAATPELSEGRYRVTVAIGIGNEFFRLWCAE
jgi:hypothetical protein